MILFFSGVFATVGLLLILGAGYLLGQKSTPKPNREQTTEEQHELEEQRRKQKEIAKDFNNLMAYDETIAYARKKVN
jgi:septal ring-binding cell division protein DamX